MTDRPDQLFKAFADPSRLRILQLLRDAERCVCELMSGLEMGQSKVSRHLAYLKRNGLIVGRDDGKWSYYRLAIPRTPLHRRLLGCLETEIDNRIVVSTKIDKKLRCG